MVPYFSARQLASFLFTGRCWCFRGAKELVHPLKLDSIGPYHLLLALLVPDYHFCLARSDPQQVEHNSVTDDNNQYFKSGWNPMHPVCVNIQSATLTITNINQPDHPTCCY
jgi:hypothetical protein